MIPAVGDRHVEWTAPRRELPTHGSEGVDESRWTWRSSLRYAFERSRAQSSPGARRNGIAAAVGAPIAYEASSDGLANAGIAIAQRTAPGAQLRCTRSWATARRRYAVAVLTRQAHVRVRAASTTSRSRSKERSSEGLPRRVIEAWDGASRS